MSTELPANPYPLNPDQKLHYYVFFKEYCQVQDVDKILADFMQRVMNKPPGRRKEIVIWRGEYTNAYGRTMWSIGIPSKLAQGIQDIFSDTVTDMYDDYGLGPPKQNGCEPYLLLTPGQIWQLDARKPPLSEGTLILAGTIFPIRYLPYVFAVSKRKKSSAKGLNELIPGLTAYLKDWAAHLTDSPFQNWPFVAENFEEMLLSNVGNIDYPFLREICQDILRLPVYEISMREHGRIVARPIWERVDDYYGVSDYAIAIVINSKLTQTQKLLALGHELGHYVFHLPFYLFFVRLQARVQGNAQVEFLAADQLTSVWWQSYYGMAEQRADLIASFFVAPPVAAQMSESGIFTGLPTTATTYEYQWLKRLEEEGVDEPGNRIPQLIEDAKRTQRERQSAPYDPRAPLFERVAWCAFQRTNADWLEALGEQERRVQNTLDALQTEIETDASPKGAWRAGKTGNLYQRVAAKQVQALFWNSGLWDPVIVEPASGAAQGYLGLTPRWLPKTRWEVIDWVLWQDAANTAPGSLEDWIEIAGRSGKGLMLFPIDPLEQHLRQSRQEAAERLGELLLLRSLLQEEETDD